MTLQAPTQFNDKQKTAFNQLPEQLQKLVLHTLHPFIRITATASNDIGLTDSKFGGTPFIPSNKQYPVTESGQPLLLIAQINFSQIQKQLSETFPDNEKFALLPKTGLLQIFIDGHCDTYGLDRNNPYPNNDSYQIRYVTDLSIEPLTTIDKLVTQSMRYEFYEEESEEEYDDEFEYTDIEPPVTKPSKLSFNLAYGSANLSYDVLEFLKALEDLGHDKDEDYDDDLWELMYDIAQDVDHKLLGTPFFAQSDPRDKSSEKILLLQIDTDQHVEWGSAGVANFFISEEQLSSLEFDKLMYHWDCS